MVAELTILPLACKQNWVEPEVAEWFSLNKVSMKDTNPAVCITITHVITHTNYTDAFQGICKLAGLLMHTVGPMRRSRVNRDFCIYATFNLCLLTSDYSCTWSSITSHDDMHTSFVLWEQWECLQTCHDGEIMGLRRFCILAVIRGVIYSCYKIC
jgi:hypothetical protein